jgi:HlyD family secretion protein
MEVYAPISQGDIGRVKKGLSATFTVDAFPDEKFDGTVTEINLMPVNVMGATLYPAVIKVANHRIGQAADPNAPKSASKEEADWVLRPGMTVNVDITRDTHKDVWMLPATALTFPLDEHYNITKAAKEKLDTRTKLENPNEWVTVWIMKDKKPWPIFVRIGGKNKDGKPGINDNNHAEVLDWDKEIKANLKPEDPKTFPQIIIAAPESKQSIFDKGQFKIS